MIDNHTHHHAYHAYCVFVKGDVLFTDTFTFLLYATSNSSIKLGYYQLRLVRGNYTIVACDAVTKGIEWSWHISHICGHFMEKSGIKIEVGKYVCYILITYCLPENKNNTYMYIH